MKRVLFIFALVLVATSFALAQKNPKVEADLIQMDRDWTAAELRGDTKAVSMYIADDFWATQTNGSSQSRAQYMADIKASKDMDVADEYVVRMLGKDVAVMTHRGTVTGEQSGQYRSTHVWMNRGGKWQIVAHHSSDIVAPAAKVDPAAKADMASPKADMAASAEAEKAASAEAVDAVTSPKKP